jgi:hypothetical protein
MDKNSPKYWEDKLKKMGMPSEIKPEHEKAALAGVEIVSTEMMSPEAEALAKKLLEEDPRNILGGFPNSTDEMVSLVETLNEEWLSQNVSPKDIHLVVHSSCVNGSDCVTLAYNGGNIYHYNTKNIRGYSRDKMLSRLKSHGLHFVEK